MDENSAADEASILAETGVRLILGCQATMRPLEKMGIERLYARTNAGFELKVHATLVALICTNTN
jgi:hypothetical protein